MRTWAPGLLSHHLNPVAIFSSFTLNVNYLCHSDLKFLWNDSYLACVPFLEVTMLNCPADVIRQTTYILWFCIPCACPKERCIWCCCQQKNSSTTRIVGSHMLYWLWILSLLAICIRRKLRIGKINQTETEVLHYIPYMWNIKKKKVELLETQNSMVVSRVGMWRK